MRRIVRADGRQRWRRIVAAIGLVVLAGGLDPAMGASRPTPGRVERVRYEADGSTTRVIVMLSRPVPFEVRIMPGESARRSARRVVLDFSNATLGPGATAPLGVENGLLQQIRTGQFTARTARVVLDLSNITKHTVTAYEDPPRVVIDIAGLPTDAPVVAAPAREPEAAPSRGASDGRGRGIHRAAAAGGSDPRGDRPGAAGGTGPARATGRFRTGSGGEGRCRGGRSESRDVTEARRRRTLGGCR